MHMKSEQGKIILGVGIRTAEYHSKSHSDNNCG